MQIKQTQLNIWILTVLKSTCGKGQFHCKLTHRCISEKWVCDGEVDCGYSDKYKLTDASDEDADSCKYY